MKKHRQDELHKRVETTMEHAGKERFQTNPFLYTRIRTKLEEPTEAVPLTWLRPALVAILLVLNSFVVWNYLQGSDQGMDETALVMQYGWEHNDASDYLLMPELNATTNETME